MLWLILTALIAYVIGSMRTFAFYGFTNERWTMALVTMQPWFGGLWRGDIYWGGKTKP